MTTVHSTISIQADTKQALDKIKELNQAVSLFNRSVNQQNADAMKSAKALEKQVLGLNFANKFETQLVKMSGSVEQFSQKLDKGKVGFREYREFVSKDNDMLEKVAQRRVKLMQSMQVALTGQISGGHRGALITPQQYEGINTATKNLQQFGKQMDLSTQKTILMNEAMRQGAVQLTNWGKNMQWAGRQLTVGLTLPITGFAAIAVKSFSDVEEQLIQIRRVYGDLETTDYEKALGEKELVQAAEAWTKYGVSVADALKVGADVAATGAQGKEAVQQMNEAIRMATLGNFDMAQSQQAIIAMMSGMGVASEDLRKNIDYLNAVENQTLLTMEDVADAVPRVGPVLKSLGGDVQDLTVFLAAMKEGGVEAAEGANAIKSGFASLINPTTAAREMFSQFGIDLRGIVQTGQGDPVKLIQDLASSMEGLGDLTRQKLIEELFGKFQFARWTALFDNINRAGSQAQETLKLAGMSASDLARISNTELEKIESSPLVKFQKNLEDLKNSLIPIGEVVLKALNPILDVVGKFASMVSGNEIATWATVLVGGFVAAVGPIKMFAGLIFNLRGALLEFRASMRSMGQPEFLTEAAIQAQLAATALDEFGREALSNVSVIQSQSVAVRDLATEYRQLASSIEAANLEIASSGTNMTRSRPGTAEAAKVAQEYKYRRKFATGGSVAGAGSGDTVPAMLSPGEFVVNAAAAKRHRGTLDAMNAGTLQEMARGTNPKYVPGRRTRDPEMMIEELVRTGIEEGVAEGFINAIKGIRQRFTPFETTLIRAMGEAGKESGQLFAEEFTRQISSKTQQAHLLPKGVTTVGDVGQSDLLTTKLRSELSALTQAFGTATKVFVYGAAKFTTSLSTNQALRGKGLPIEQYVQETQHTFAAQRQQELQNMLPGAGAGQMLQVDKAIADYIRSQAQSGKQVLVNDEIVAAAIREITTGAGQMSDELRTLIIDIDRTGKEIVEFGVAIDKATADAIKREHGQGMQVGETKNIALPGGVTTSLTRHQNATTLGNVYGPQGTRLYGGEAITSAGNVRARPERIQTGRGAGSYNVPAPQLVQSLLAEQKVVETITDEMKRDLKTASPSKETEKIGKDIDKGLAVGMKAGEPEVAKAAAHAANVAVDTMQVTVGGRYGGHIRQVTVPAGGGGQLPRERVPVGTAATRLPNVEGEVAKQAKQAADAHEDVATAARGSAPAIEKETVERTRHISKLSKATLAMDAVSGATMLAGGALGEFSQKIFAASLMLSSMSTMRDLLLPGGGGGLLGKAGKGLKGEVAAARAAAQASKAASTATGVARVGAAAGRGATVAGGVARGLGSVAMAGGPAGLAIAGTVAATAALAYSFYKLNKSANKYNEALSISTETMQKAAEQWGFELKTVQTGSFIGKGGADQKEIQQARQFIDENLTLQSDYIKDMKDETLQQAALNATLTKFIAQGAPKEFAEEVGRQLAANAKMDFGPTKSLIDSLYDTEGKLVDEAGTKILDSLIGPVQKAQKKLEGMGGQPSGWQKFWGAPRNNGEELGKRIETADFLEASAYAAGDSFEQVAILFQEGRITTKQYFDSIKSLQQQVESQRGVGVALGPMEDVGQEVRDKIGDMMIKANPALEVWSDELKDSTRIMEAFALQTAKIDLSGLFLSAQQKGMNPDTLIGYAFGAYERVQKSIQPRLQNLQGDRSKAKTELDSATAAVTTAEENATAAQQAIDDMQDSLEAITQPLEDQVYAYDRILDDLGEQRDLLNDQVDIQQEKLDLIDEEIDKIEEARDKQLENIEDITDAQLKSLEAMQKVQDRATSERSAFSSIGQALQAGDVAGALEGQRSYTQEFGANTIQDQIDEVNKWHDKSVEAINDEADTKIDAEKRKQDEIQNTIDGIDKQIEALDKQITANERAKDTIQDTITVKEHEFELDKRAADKRLKSANEQIVIAGQRKKAAQDNLSLLDQEITRLQSMPAQAAQAIIDSGKKLGMTEAKTKEVLSGEAVTEYLKTGTATKIKFTGSDNKVQEIEFSHQGGMVDTDSWSGTGKLKSDETPRILQAGEYVLRKDAVKKVGKEKLDAMNKGLVRVTNERDESTNPFRHTGGFVRQFTAMNQALMTKKTLKNMKDYGAMRMQAEQDRMNSITNLGDTLAGAISSGIANGETPWAAGYENGRIPLNALAMIPGGYMWPDAAKQFNSMAEKYRNEMNKALTGGGYRSYEDQARLYYNYIHGIGGQALAAKPGQSNHGWGLAVDVKNANSYGGTNFKWLDKNAQRYGFVNDVKTEPWHWHYKMHKGGIVGKDEVPTILQKGELVIPKDKWQYGSGGGAAVSMPTYSGGNTGMTASMPTYSSGTSAASFVPSGGGGGGSGGASSSYSSSANNAYAVNININNPNASATEIANTVHARINRANKVARR